MTEAALTSERAAEVRKSFAMRAGPDVAAIARAELGALRPLLGEELAGDVALIVSELVTNAYRHSGATEDTIAVELRVGDGRVRGEVTDGGAGFRAAPVPAERRGVGGWGIHIVEQLSDRWGVRSGNGCRVWFELDRPQLKLRRSSSSEPRRGSRGDRRAPSPRAAGRRLRRP